MNSSCKKAIHLCNKSQYREAKFRERIALRFHLLYCSACTRFSKRNKALTMLCRRTRLAALTETEQESMKKALQQHL